MLNNKKSVTTIVMVNYRTPELAIESLRSVSLQKDALNGGKVIIVDNNSADGSPEKIQRVISKEGWSDWVQLLAMPRNGGFAYGNNIGFKHALSHHHVDYLMLLNPDTLVRDNALKELIDFMDAHPKAGVSGSRLENSDGGIECSAHNFHSPIGELLSGAKLGMLTKLLSKYEVTPPLQNEKHRCDWVSGSSMIIRRQVIDDIGFFDEGFFLYYEEVDFFQRAVKANWQIWYVPESVVMHIEGASTGIKQIKRRPAYWLYSRRRYYVKHYGISGLFLADILWILGVASFRIRRFLHLGAQGNYAGIPWLTFDILWGDIKGLFSGEIWHIKQEGETA